MRMNKDREQLAKQVSLVLQTFLTSRNDATEFITEAGDGTRGSQQLMEDLLNEMATCAFDANVSKTEEDERGYGVCHFGYENKRYMLFVGKTIVGVFRSKGGECLCVKMVRESPWKWDIPIVLQQQ